MGADYWAERGGFEPPEPVGSTVFKTDAIVHSAISPSTRIAVTGVLSPSLSPVLLDIVLQVCRWGLVLVFLASAIAKLRSPDVTLNQFTELGIPAPEIARYALPAIEIAVVIALIVATPWGGVAAFVLLTGFTTMLVSIIRSGRTVGCACFGGVSNEPVAWGQVKRNGVFLAMALLVALAA